MLNLLIGELIIKSHTKKHFILVCFFLFQKSKFIRSILNEEKLPFKIFELEENCLMKSETGRYGI